MSVACCCWMSTPGIMTKFMPVQLETTPSRLQSANGDCKMPLIKSCGLILNSVKCGYMPLRINEICLFWQGFHSWPTFVSPGLINCLDFLHWLVFINVPITEFSQMSNILSQYYLLTVHTNGSDNLLVPIAFLLPQRPASYPSMDWSSCLAVNLGLTSSPLLFAESHVSLFLGIIGLFW